MGLARQLSGIPAPRQSPSSSRTSSRATSPLRFTDRIEAHNARKEDELAKQEADQIVRRGEAEAQVAVQGAYSEDFDREGHNKRQSSLSAQGSDGASVKDLQPKSGGFATPLQSQGSWGSPATSDMSESDLVTANSHLLTRLQPFLANPICNIPISAFFYNESVSRQKSVETDASGHFTLRAALDFVPTHVRILASEQLSSTQTIQITEPTGVSVISDIDDTIKHSAIGSGAKEIFKNVFVREFADLSVKGVKEWYANLASMGCFFHYVSNSPWQLYPLLTSFFSAAGLPPGSFHLKQYSGMLQGIFEPVAERKKGTLERILRDFPDRRFILVGDSGEADLEVYTDMVLEHPGRIIGVFIRDVTTVMKQKFFDTARGPQSSASSPSLRADGLKQSKSLHRPYVFESSSMDDDDPDLSEAVRRSLADQAKTPVDEAKPKLPPRRPTAPATLEEDLIDLNFEDTPSAQARVAEGESHSGDLPLTKENIRRRAAPPRPLKPSSAVRMTPKPSVSGATSANVADREERPALPSRPVGHADESHKISEVAMKSVSLQRDAPLLPPPRNAAKSGTQGPPSSLRSSKTMSSSWFVNESQDDQQDAQSNRKEEAWMRRWARAKEILDRKGVTLRSWRVGGDVQDETTRLVRRAQGADGK